MSITGGLWRRLAVGRGAGMDEMCKDLGGLGFGCEITGNGAWMVAHCPGWCTTEQWGTE